MTTHSVAVTPMPLVRRFRVEAIIALASLLLFTALAIARHTRVAAAFLLAGVLAAAVSRVVRTRRGKEGVLLLALGILVGALMMTYPAMIMQGLAESTGASLATSLRAGVITLLCGIIPGGVAGLTISIFRRQPIRFFWQPEPEGFQEF